MKQIFLLLFFLTPLFGATNPPPFTEEDEEAFYEKLQDELQDSEERVHNMVIDKANNRTIFTHGRQVMLDSAKNAMQTKYTLYNNFYGKPSLQSPEVRQKLMSIFRGDEISTDDLQDLQTAVMKWRRKTQGTE